MKLTVITTAALITLATCAPLALVQVAPSADLLQSNNKIFGRQRLREGCRINNAKDDEAGLGIAGRLLKCSP
ncbi:hypothetical protein T440DRAFT_167102 [Plenodomus tracheiphilus IPT5]|uniref:Uncharacterized protein n=1 Tax=Plenodomus tracheiphilus IPT5 TaxID=1408161 RepID=A0A6A7AZ31_9PLEO|nr:hypothetical protein T440DRAFT_167102 [Plenodomus tracheiphilus IPT5]